MPLQDTTTISTTHVRGAGIWVSQSDGFGQGLKTLGRRVIDDASDRDIGSPSYQFALVAKPTGDNFLAFLHGKRARKIFYHPLNVDQDPHVAPAPVAWLSLLSVATSAQGTAFTAFYLPTPDDVLAVFNLIDADGMGLMFARVSAGPITITLPNDFTSTDLGFSPSDATELSWRTLVSRPVPGTEQVRFLGAAERAISRSGPGDLSRKEVYTFVLDFTDPDNPTVAETAVRVAADVPFDVHQLVEGKNQPLDGSPKKMLFWCAGRGESEYFNPTVLSRSISPEGELAGLGPAGIWVCENEDFSDWKLVWHASAATNNSEMVHFDLSADDRPSDFPVGSHPRDVGLVFDEAWQRLTFLGIDNDPGQDPYHERPLYEANEGGPPGPPPAPPPGGPPG